MNINGAFPSNYLNAAALQGHRIVVTISHVAMEDIGDEHKAVLYFQGKEKGLILNKTNANMLKEITGSDETEEWKGMPVVLYVAKVDFQGRRVDAIRVDYPAAGTPKPVAVATATPVTVDDIPF